MNLNDMKSRFPFFKANPKEIYFDTAATALKPQMVIDGIAEYYINYGTNVHSSDSDIAYKTYQRFNQVRQQVLKFVNGNQPEEVVFTSGTTFGVNLVAFGIENEINPGDEIFLTVQEHGANLLPWYRLAERKGAIIKFLPEVDYKIDLEQLEKILTPKTKIVAFANLTNVLGYENDPTKITSIIKKYNPNITVFVDCAQSLVIREIDVKKWGVDFIVFSAHKLFGPTGIGVLWGKKSSLERLAPLTVGGGMNTWIDCKSNSYKLKPLPTRLEAGSPNSAGVFGLAKALDFVNEIGFDNLVAHEERLKKYAAEQFAKHLSDKVKVYNADSPSGAIVFNVHNHFAQDVATHLGSKNHITVRSGDHCAKLIGAIIPGSLSIRASFSIYNNEAEIDALVNAIKIEKDFLGKIA